MTLLEMIAEWRKGCSCAGPLHDTIFRPKHPTSPTECEECTAGLIDAMEARIRKLNLDPSPEFVPADPGVPIPVIEGELPGRPIPIIWGEPSAADEVEHKAKLNRSILDRALSALRFPRAN